MTQGNATRVVARLQAVNWHDEDAFEYRKSRSVLMREYLRRTARWAHALNATDEWPFFDIAAYVAPSVRTDPDLVDFVANNIIKGNIGLKSVQTTVHAAVRWATLLDTPGVDVPALEDPFEPLVMMYERGGGFTTEHGFIELGLASIRIRTWQDHLSPDPVIPLDPALLDSLDEAESSK